jgi:hypothetical protein
LRVGSRCSHFGIHFALGVIPDGQSHILGDILNFFLLVPHHSDFEEVEVLLMFIEGEDVVGEGL